ncbi:unnamed protein product [Camellia sinensis]
MATSSTPPASPAAANSCWQGRSNICLYHWMRWDPIFEMGGKEDRGAGNPPTPPSLRHCLLEILGPDINGGLFLPILGALPYAVLIFVFGLSGTKEIAQSQVSVGMGLLAGSTVMLLTVIWGTCVIVGKCDLHDSIAIDGKDTKKFSLTGSGVTIDIWTSYSARIMAISVIPFLVVQIPQVMNSTSGRHLEVLIALVVSVCMLISYCLYQRRRLAYAKHKHVISGFLKYLRMRALGRFIKDNGELNTEIVEKLFHTIDGDKDGFISEPELKALIGGMRLDEINFDQINLNEDDAMKKVINDFDTSNDYKIDLCEFINGISKWLDEAKQAGASSREAGPTTMKYLDDFHKLYGAVTMNNALCLSVFLALVYARGLTWDFSTEVLVILVICLVMGAFASFRTTFPLWTALVAFFLYPFSLALVYVLDYVLG